MNEYTLTGIFVWCSLRTGGHHRLFVQRLWELDYIQDKSEPSSEALRSLRRNLAWQFHFNMRQ